MYHPLNLDNTYDMMSEEVIITESNEVITCSKMHCHFLIKGKKNHPNHRKVSLEKMPFHVCNTSKNNKFLWDDLIVLLFHGVALVNDSFQPTNKLLHITLQSITCMELFVILKMYA